MADFLFGYLGRAGNVLISPAFPRAEPFRDGVARVERPGSAKTHVIRPDGADIGGWDKVLPAEEGMVAVASREKDQLRWGFVDTDGNTPIPLRYAEVGAFREGLAPARMSELWGFVDRAGEIAIPLRFNAAGPFSEGHSAVAIEGKAGHIDRAGRMVVMLEYEATGPFSGGLARVVRGGKEAYVSVSGQIVGEWWDQVRDPVEGFGIVRKEGKDAVVDSSGRLRSAWFEEILWVTPGFFLAREPKGLRLYGLDGQPVVEPRFERVYTPVGTVVPVRKDQRWGWIDLDTLQLVGPRWEELGPISEDRIAIRVQGRWGFADRTGRDRVPAKWTKVRGFQDGLAAVQVEHRWGFVDPDGVVRIPVRHGQVDQFSAERAPFRDVERDRVVHGPAPGVHQVPPLGLQHHWFEGVHPDDELGVTVVLDGELSPSQRIRVEQIVAGWEATIDPADPVRTTRAEQPWIHPRGLRIRLTNAVNARSDLSTLVTSLLALRIPVRELIFGRWRQGLPVRNPWFAHTKRYEAFEARMQALFDDEAPPPDPEPDESGPTTAADKGGLLVYEERGYIPNLHDIKLYWGTGRPPASEQRARADEVETAVEAAFLRRFFKAFAAPPRIRPDSDGVRVVAAELLGRTSYRFSIDAEPLRQSLSDRVFRYREAEAIEALADVIRELGLAPVLGWRRIVTKVQGAPRATAYELELWEYPTGGWVFTVPETEVTAVTEAPPVRTPQPREYRDVPPIPPPPPTAEPAPPRRGGGRVSVPPSPEDPPFPLVSAPPVAAPPATPDPERPWVAEKPADETPIPPPRVKSGPLPKATGTPARAEKPPPPGVVVASGRPSPWSSGDFGPAGRAGATPRPPEPGPVKAIPTGEPEAPTVEKPSSEPAVRRETTERVPSGVARDTDALPARKPAPVARPRSEAEEAAIRADDEETIHERRNPLTDPDDEDITGSWFKE